MEKSLSTRQLMGIKRTLQHVFFTSDILGKMVSILVREGKVSSKNKTLQMKIDILSIDFLKQI